MTHLDSVSGIGVGISQVASPWLCLYCLKNCRLQTFSIWLPLHKHCAVLRLESGHSGHMMTTTQHDTHLMAIFQGNTGKPVPE